MPINDTVKYAVAFAYPACLVSANQASVPSVVVWLIRAITLHLDFSPISLQKWQIQTQFDQSLQAQRELGVIEDNMDDIKVRSS